MGTTLTGTTPQDTYDSLIKVTDNGPLSGSLKRLTDGLGNDSALSLSTTAASVTGDLTASGASSAFTGGALEIQGSVNAIKTLYINRYGVASGSQHRLRAQNAYFEIASANSEPIVLSGGNVGIGTSVPTSGGVSSTLRVKQTSDASSGFTGLGIETAAATGELLYFGHTGTTAIIGQTYLGAGAYQPIAFSVGGSERFRVTSNGVTFNGDTAAANALDDYEEGTWTISATPTTSGTITLYSSVNAGRYTKIGRQVMVQGLAEVESVSSPVGTSVELSGLPFPIAERTLDYDTRIGGSVAINVGAASFKGFEGQSKIEIYVDASTIATGSQFYFSFTYTV